MITLNRILLSMITLCCSMTLSCQQGCTKKTEIPLEHNEKVVEQAIKSSDAVASKFAELSLTGLSDRQIDSVSKLFDEEICPCGCPKSLAQCIDMPGCKPAKLLAQWAVDQLRTGAPENYLFQAVTDEIGGYLAQPKIIDTKNAYQKGNPNAKIVVVEFADFECPMCKLASSELKEFLKANQELVQVYFMHFPLSNHQYAEKAAVAAEAAGKAGKFWEMHDQLFAHKEALTEDAIKKIAMTILSMTQMKQFEKDLNDPALLQKIRSHRDYATNVLGLSGTPTFMFNGRPYNLSSDKDGYQLRLAMEKVRSEIDCQASAK